LTIYETIVGKLHIYKKKKDTQKLESQPLIRRQDFTMFS